jgi:hypothetical protein
MKEPVAKLNSAVGLSLTIFCERFQGFKKNCLRVVIEVDRNAGHF